LRLDPVADHFDQSARLAFQTILHRLDQHAERELRVADQREVRGNVLVDVARLIRVVNELLVRSRETNAETGGREAGTGTEYEVRLLHVLEHSLRHGDAARAE